MNGLIIFLGESFRLGNQGTRNRGSPESYTEQIKACNSHISFIEQITSSYKLNSVSVYITSYTTQYDNDLLMVYEKYLIGNDLYNDVIGITALLHNTINKIDNIDQYDFIKIIRIDLFLKQHFIDIFNPTINMILFPSVCWKLGYKVGIHPRINSVMLFIPKKYYGYIKYITNFYHNMWYDFMECTDLTYDDMDTIINTYHDSDSFKDFNPLYYMVNRRETNRHYSRGYIFDKYNFT